MAYYPILLTVLLCVWRINSYCACAFSAAPDPVVVVDTQRRSLFGACISSTAVVVAVVVTDPTQARAAATAAGDASSDSSNTVSSLLPLLQQARRQLDAIPKMIENEQWDLVRQTLITPPLSECWTSNAKLLKKWAAVVPDGNELEAFELREEAISHLRYLDMSVYNNVFNPIVTTGKTGASKELIRSYYEDPIKELKASEKVMDDLLALKE